MATPRLRCHVCVIDGVFEEVAGNADVQASPPGVVFHPATGIDAQCVAQAQITLCKRIFSAFVGRGLLQSFEAKEMLTYQHRGCSMEGLRRAKPLQSRPSGCPKLVSYLINIYPRVGLH